MSGHKATMLGTGLIGLFYTRDAARRSATATACTSCTRARRSARARSREREGVPECRRPTSRQAIAHADTDTVVVGLPERPARGGGRARAPPHGKAVLCTKPLARTAAEAKRILDTVEGAGVFGGYLEDLAYTPKTLKALAMVRARRDRRRDVGALARDAPGPAQRLVLGRDAGGRRADRRPRLPLHRDRPQLHRQGQPAGRGDVLGRHARAPDRGRGQRDRADPLRERARSASSRSAGRSAAGWTCATRSPAPRARSGSTTSCAPASRCSRSAPAAATWPRRPRPQSGWLFPVGDEVARARLRRHVHRHVRRASTQGRAADGDLLRRLRGQRRHRRLLPLGRRRGSGSRSSSRTGAAAAPPRIAARRAHEDGKSVIKEEQLPDGRRKLILKDESTGVFEDVVT